MVLRGGRDDAPLGASSRSLDPDNVHRCGQICDKRLARACSEILRGDTTDITITI
jgi:hypothetical protein